MFRCGVCDAPTVTCPGFMFLLLLLFMLLLTTYLSSLRECAYVHRNVAWGPALTCNAAIFYSLTNSSAMSALLTGHATIYSLLTCWIFICFPWIYYSAISQWRQEGPGREWWWLMTRWRHPVSACHMVAVTEGLTRFSGERLENGSQAHQETHSQLRQQGDRRTRRGDKSYI